MPIKTQTTNSFLLVIQKKLAKYRKFMRFTSYIYYFVDQKNTLLRDRFHWKEYSVLFSVIQCLFSWFQNSLVIFIFMH
jgi:hypothetical protein